MRDEPVVAPVQVEPGDLLDALDPAVQRSAVQVQRLGGGRDVTARVQERGEALDELVAAPVRREREQRRGRLGPRALRQGR